MLWIILINSTIGSFVKGLDPYCPLEHAITIFDLFLRSLQKSNKLIVPITFVFIVSIGLVKE